MLSLENQSLKSLSSWPYFVVLCFLVVLIFLPILYANMYVNVAETDFEPHLLSAQALENDPGSVPAFILAHPAWQWLIILINAVSGVSLETASVIGALFCEALTAIVLLRWFMPALSKNDLIPLRKGVIILGLMVASPISVFWLLDQRMYLGYIGISSYHNPSILLLRPFAILQFIYAYRFFSKEKPGVRETGIAFAVSLLATFIKPSFAICILPALVSIALLQWVGKKTVDAGGLVWGFLIPIVGMLGWQFLITYVTDDSAGIAFLPFKVMTTYSDYLLPKFVVSILFPLVVSIFYLKRALLDARMRLAWSIFLFGAFFTYFWAETGNRFYDGNFGWSGEIALVILFITSTLFYLEAPEIPRYGDNTLRVLWTSHVVFGIAYYFYCLFSGSYA